MRKTFAVFCSRELCRSSTVCYEHGAKSREKLEDDEELQIDWRKEICWIAAKPKSYPR